mmetsp:Transcript_5483/g.19072  ORF Transcript_5483/g.19072 Transcript_5483/m.19072 type:complete len:763 (-) Transcript_5483:1656-3944(-)
MKLRVTQAAQPVHTALVTAVGWNVANELVSASDDKDFWRWDMHGEAQGKVGSVDAFVTDLHWIPCASKRNMSGNDLFAVSCTDGSFKTFAKNGRLEKSVPDAHRGAVISLRWSHEGSALATAGEDGVIKVWSRNGQLRSTLATVESSVFAVVWSPDSDQVLFASGKNLSIKPLQPSSKQMQWKAHDGVVLKCDWNPLNNLIVSGGEDCRYKVWDSFGRLLASSAPLEFVVTSVSWSPDGKMFAVGSYNQLRLCAKTGWTCAIAMPKSGSLLNLAWTQDGTQVAGAGGNGSVVCAEVIEQKIEWAHVSAMLEDSNRIRVRDVVAETVDELDFRDRVTKWSLCHGHMVVATATQACIYDTNNWNTPHIFDLKEPVTLILQSASQFLTVDAFAGLQLYSYEGRQICNPKFQGLRTEFLDEASVSLSSDCLCLIDSTDSKCIRFFDTSQGKPVGEPLKHTAEVVMVGLNQQGSSNDRKVVFVDRNRDLFISPVQGHAPFKLGTMVDSFVWHEEADMLAAMIDQKLVVWYYPNTVYVDKDLLPTTKYVKDSGEFGKVPQLMNFSSSRCLIACGDGATVMGNVSPYPMLLHKHVSLGAWDKAVRLCRFCKDKALWACLAAMAIHNKDLNTAEVAYAAIEEVDKLRYVLYIKEIPTEEGRNAELAVFRRRTDEAEAILLQAGLTYRAIKVNLDLFNWDRALELAVNYKTHVDTVLWTRSTYLKAAGRPESNKRFLQYEGQVEVDEEQIKAKMEQELEKEKQRPGAKRYM